MFNREFHVKKSPGAFMAKGAFFLIMFLFSITCSLFPKLHYMDELYIPYIVGIGVSASIYFSYLFVWTIIRGIKPADAFILTENGIYNFIDYPGKGLFVDWANVSSVKTFGSQKNHLLGIDLYDTEIFIGTIKKSIGDEIRANIEAGLPAVVIKQSEIGPRLSQILPAFNDFISATRPIPIAKNPLTNELENTNNIPVVKSIPSEESTEKPFVVEMAVFPSELNVLPDVQKSKKSAKKDLDEIFVLPPDPSYEPKINSSIGGILKNEHNFKIDLVNSSIKNTNTKEIPLINNKIKSNLVDKKSSEPTENKKADEIKTLDDLLSKFSVPVIETDKK
ncbi:MAG: hypothetical protein A2Y15_03860 [Clostridiales bacterium GWF2_36_10]|nr:MAG: hypothetical protein A2Y15_03860 [Clostridiales bacterium GWF2_36_10]HAN21206.1 hypothetical protein [Clostridiales bacterium]